MFSCCFGMISRGPGLLLFEQDRSGSGHFTFVAFSKLLFDQRYGAKVQLASIGMPRGTILSGAGNPDTNGCNLSLDTYKENIL